MRESIQIIIFLIFIISAISKSVLHIRLINKKQNISIFKKPIIIGFLCQPFVPIISKEYEKERRTINYLVIIVYISLASAFSIILYENMK